MTPSHHLAVALAVAAGLALLSGGARAREPGIAPVTPPGLTLGIPIAASLPAGLYWTQRSSFYDATLTNGAGDYNGQHLSVFVNSSQLTYVPGFKLLGATYKAYTIFPFVDQWLDRTTRATGVPGQYSRLGMANPKFQPLDLTWDLGDGYHVGAGVGAYVPIGQYEKGANVNLGTNFYTVESSLGFTYLRDGWNASLQAVYATNSANELLKYRSGDELTINATVTRNFGGFNVGPVAYLLRQVTGDSNNGGRATFGGRTFAAPSNAAVGALVSHAFGTTILAAYGTKEVECRNTVGGYKIWLTATFKLF